MARQGWLRILQGSAQNENAGSLVPKAGKSNI